MPKDIEITTEDVECIAKEMQLQLDDAERMAVLREVGSCDVQAGPGSGKTTVLIAKLAILAKKWPYRDRGVCVVSHTNVARREIEQRLNRSTALRGLLQYPHFIGTIQAFTDQFLAIPFLRREQIEVTAIDNDIFGARAWSVFSKDHSKARFAIVNYFNKAADPAERARWVVSNLRLDGARMGVTHPMVSANRFPGPATMTGQALITVKNVLRAEGYFRFDDMFAFAEACLLKVGYVAPALRRRFPWVFVDELQDTSAMQDSVIEQVFSAQGCVFQRFGDRNQSIFDFDGDTDEGESLFDRRKTLYLNSTHRFGQPIADLVSRFTTIKRQKLVGNAELKDDQHTAYIYARSAIKRVVPLFGDLVLKTVPREILENQSVCAIGNRVNSAQHAKDNFPAFLGDYVEVYVSPKASKAAAPDTLLGYVVQARKKWAEVGTGAEPYRFAMSGILALLRRAGKGGVEGLPQSKTEVHRALLQSGGLASLQRLLWSVLNPVVALEERLWSELMKDLSNLFGLSKPTKEMVKFLGWEGSVGVAATSGEKLAVKLENSYQHVLDADSVTIRFDSIHGVKGETHAATLVVETFAKKHDLEALLPILTGEKHGSEVKDSVRSDCKRIFVAMSRPSHLVCLAISGEHIDEVQIAGLKANGWKIVRVDD